MIPPLFHLYFSSGIQALEMVPWKDFLTSATPGSCCAKIRWSAFVLWPSGWKLMLETPDASQTRSPLYCTIQVLRAPFTSPPLCTWMCKINSRFISFLYSKIWCPKKYYYGLVTRWPDLGLAGCRGSSSFSRSPPPDTRKLLRAMGNSEAVFLPQINQGQIRTSLIHFCFFCCREWPTPASKIPNVSSLMLCLAKKIKFVLVFMFLCFATVTRAKKRKIAKR